MPDQSIAMPFFQSDVIVSGLLLAVLGVIFWLSDREGGIWPKIFRFVPPLLLCYLIPALLNSLGIISSKESELYTVAKNYFLPTSLILLTLSIDIKGIIGLGPRALGMFLAGTIGVIIGGPLALMLMGIFDPSLLAEAGDESVWRGLATLAGSWIGGGANQTAMLEVFQYNKDSYSAMLAVDIIVYNFWMALLIWGIGKSDIIDRYLKADNSRIEELKEKVILLSRGKEQPMSFSKSMQILGVGFGLTALSHLCSDLITAWIAQNASPELQNSFIGDGFFWMVVLATMFGLMLSFTKAKELEWHGASKWGTIFLYFLIATIGMKINLGETFNNINFIILGFIWIIIHGLFMFGVAKLIKAPYFFIAVGSTANVGGAASAPVVAGAFHSSLATVGVLLAVFGYAAGTYGAILCAKLMEMVSN